LDYSDPSPRRVKIRAQNRKLAQFRDGTSLALLGFEKFGFTPQEFLIFKFEPG
jgi:hypothetical protein